MKLRSAILTAFSVPAVAASACSSSSNGTNAKTCTPGASVACVGPGGCAGGQVCSADGTALEACICAGGGQDAGNGGQNGQGTDAGGGAQDASQASDAGLSTTLGAVHAIWTLKGAVSSSVLTCAQVTGQTGVVLTLTPMGAGSAIDKTFPCAGNTGDYVDVPLGSYTVSGSIINSMSQALGTASPASLMLATSPCDSVVSNECTKNLPITILVDGL